VRAINDKGQLHLNQPPEPDSSREHVTFQEILTKGRMLYYPGAGPDCEFAIREFHREIDSFWFADLIYPSHSRSHGQRSRSLPRFVGFEIVETKAQIVELGNSQHCPIQRIQLVHRASGRQIEAVFLTADAVSIFEALEQNRKPIDVFVHRADGVAEGGSNLWWLHPHPGLSEAPGFLDRVLAIMEAEGRIVSDGCLAKKEFQTEFDGLAAPPKAFAYNAWQLEPIRETTRHRFPTWIWTIQRDS
jgi:hypothetical protein